MTKEELVIQATKDIITAAIANNRLGFANVTGAIKKVAEAVSKAYDDCQK